MNAKTVLFTSSLVAILLIPAAAPLSAADKAVGIGPSFKGPVGLQLYSLRGLFIKNVPDTLPKVREFGFKEVELAGTYNLEPAKFKEMLDANGLVPISGHFPFARYRDDAEGVARDAKALGLKYAGCAWIDHKDDFDEAECRAAIEVFNKAGEVLARHGIRFVYHCHGYEFRPQGDGTLMDLLMKETDPKKVAFQMDVLWVVHPGHDPVKWLEKYPGRWELMHLKDLRKGAPTGILTGKGDPNDNVPLGTGQMDWKRILPAAQKAGVKYYFIEDEAADAVNQIPQTLKYLEQLKW